MVHRWMQPIGWFVAISIYFQWFGETHPLAYWLFLFSFNKNWVSPLIPVYTCLHFVRPFGKNLKVLHVTATKMPFSHWLVDRALLPPTLFQLDVDGIPVIDLTKTCFGFGFVQQWEPQFAADMNLIWWFFKMGDPPPYHMMRYTNRVSYFCTSPRRDWEWLGCSDHWKQSSQCRVGCFYLRDLFKQSPIPSVVSSRRGIRVHFCGEKRWTRVESARQWLHPRSKPWFLVVNFHTIGTIQVVLMSFFRGMGWVRDRGSNFLEGLIPRITRNLCLVLGFDPNPIHYGE